MLDSYDAAIIRVKCPNVVVGLSRKRKRWCCNCLLVFEGPQTLPGWHYSYVHLHGLQLCRLFVCTILFLYIAIRIAVDYM